MGGVLARKPRGARRGAPRSRAPRASRLPRAWRPKPLAPVAIRDELALDAVAAARAAHLRHVDDHRPGIRRAGHGKSVRYLDPDGRPVRDPDTLARIRSLAIPPAWRDVWICPVENGHIQATGRDARGRKQYRYHPRWRAVRDETKYHRMIAFGEALPTIRARVDHDLALPGLPREKVLATVVRLMELTLIRVGNEEYARANHSFGLTTLRNQHVAVDGSHLRFRFRGKHGKWHEVEAADPRLARIVARCRELPGHELFQYVDDEGALRPIDSADVNDYLREITGCDFTSKDFRTWSGTVLAAEALALCEPCVTKRAAKKNVVQAIAEVAERLGNTVAVCRKCYVHPGVVDAYLDGDLLELLAEEQRGRRALAAKGALRGEEQRVLAFLRRVERETAAATSSRP